MPVAPVGPRVEAVLVEVRLLRRHRPRAARGVRLGSVLNRSSARLIHPRLSVASPVSKAQAANSL